MEKSSGELVDRVQSARLFEEVTCSRNDLEACGRGHALERSAIQLDHLGVGAADDQECGAAYEPERSAREVGVHLDRRDGEVEVVVVM